MVVVVAERARNGGMGASLLDRPGEEEGGDEADEPLLRVAGASMDMEKCRGFVMLDEEEDMCRNAGNTRPSGGGGAVDDMPSTAFWSSGSHDSAAAEVVAVMAMGATADCTEKGEWMGRARFCVS